MTAPPGRPIARELRVHGVGGSHGAKMLGHDSSQDVVVVGEGLGGTAVLARRSDPDVESYDWGDLTSGTGSKPFWIFLLPFTLLNLAGWMHPPVDQSSVGLVKLVRGLVHALSVLLTATYVFTLGIVLVDLLGYQWARRLAGAPPGDIVDEQRLGVVVALLALGVLVYALSHVAGSSQHRFEEAAPVAEDDGGLSGDERWGVDERLRARRFFFHPGAAKRRLRLHRWLALACFLLVAGQAVYTVFLEGGTPPSRLDVGRFLRLTSGVAYLLVLALWLTALGARRKAGERWTRSGPAIAATLAFALVNAVFSGAVLALVARLNDWPDRPATTAGVAAGPEVSLVDVWGGLVLVLSLAAAALVGVVIFRPPGRADDVPVRRSRPGRPLDGLDPSMTKPLRRSRFFVTLARRAGTIACLVAALIYSTGLVMVGLRLERRSGFPFLELPAPGRTDGLLYRVGAYVLPLLVLLLIQVVRKGRRGARTFASTLWDIFTFWPRRFSPFAVRPYSERAVPELQGRIVHHIDDGSPRRPLLLSVHSQGSVLGFAALSSLSDDQLARLALVTYGCPLSSIYPTFFPAYFGPAEVTALRTRLPSTLGPGLLGWRNFYRDTDPIGGPVFGHDSGAPPESDCRLADPFPGPADVGGAGVPPLERDPVPWTRISGHSYYGQEPALKRWSADVRSALASGRGR